MENSAGWTKIGSSGDVNTKPLHRITRFADLPADAASYRAPDGTEFFAPPDTNFADVFKAGQGITEVEPKDLTHYIADNVGQFGRFDFQRSVDIFYSGYADASNYAAGLFMNGAGFSYQQTIIFAGLYAATHSQGGVTARRARWWTYGYLAGAVRSPLSPLPGDLH